MIDETSEGAADYSKRTREETFLHYNESEGAFADGGDSCHLSAGTQTFCDL